MPWAKPKTARVKMPALDIKLLASSDNRRVADLYG
jgi:hypothetical protein